MRSRLERLGAPAFHTYLEDVGLRAIAIGALTLEHRDATIARSAAHNPSTSRIESEAALNPSLVEKKVHPRWVRFIGS